MGAVARGKPRGIGRTVHGVTVRFRHVRGVEVLHWKRAHARPGKKLTA
jgi:hypothetical protein